ncbi:MAG TPA: response regulator, partial [Methylotenera sp.]|nr:response regulator [Methylotenera sp.]
KLREHFVCIIHDIHAKPQLFNAIHAAQSSHYVQDEKVVTLAQHYAAQSHARPLRILIAEDNKVNQQILAGILEHTGHQASLAESGEQALDMLADSLYEIDLLIVDMNMPDYSGPEVIRAMRYMDTSINLPVIMLTADATPEARKRSLDAGADAFLTKPIDSRILLETIAKLAANVTEKNISPNIKPAISNQEWLDPQTLDDLSQLGGGQDFLDQLINGFITDGEKHIQNISQAANDDYLAFRESLHALKGSAAEMGAHKITELCRQAENVKPHNLNAPQTKKLIDSLLAAFEKTVQILKTAAIEKRAKAE